MGLDMYLRAERYLSPYNDESKEISENVALIVGANPSFNVQTVTLEAGYWRKANQIHKWFVDNVQEGNDDCGDHHVSRDQLVELKELCEKILANKTLAEQLLPTQSGFFFGGTEYDDYYFEDLTLTIQIIDRALTLSDDWDFEYHSSW